MTGISPMYQLKSLLDNRLGVIRRRVILLGLALAGGMAVVAWLVTLIVGAWLDLALDLSDEIRLGIGLVAAAAAVGLFFYLLAKSAQSLSRFFLSRKLDATANARGQIVAGLDLSATDWSAAAPVTAGLAQLATYEAVKLIDAIRPEQAVPRRPLFKPIYALFLIGCFLLILGLAMPRLVWTQCLRFMDPFGDHPPYSAIVFQVDPADAKTIYGGVLDIHAQTSGATVEQVDLVFDAAKQAEQVIPMFPEGDGKFRATLADVVSPGQYFLRSGRSRSKHFQLSVITVPQIEKVSFQVHLPDYTNRPPFDGPLPDGGLSGLPGTQVTVRVQSNRPLSGGTISLTSASGTTQIRMLGNGNESVGDFEINSAGRFDLKVTDTDGQASTDSFGGTINLLTDQKPFVRLVEPMATSFATPDAAVKVLAIAEDDFGISKLEIFRGLNDTQFRSADIPTPRPMSPRVEGPLMLQLSEYGLSPGDVIKLFARTQDNDPAGPKGAESTVAMIHIISQSDMDRMMVSRNAMEVLQSKYSQAERELEALRAKTDELAKKLAGQDPKTPLTDEEQKEIEQLSSDLQKASDNIEKLADHDLPIDLDQALKSQLKQMSQTLKDGSDLAKEAGKPGISAAGALDKLKELQKKLGDQNEQFKDNATVPLEYMAKILPLMQDQMRFLSIHERQDDLASRLASLKSSNAADDPQVKARMRDLEDEQSTLRNDLQGLLDDIDNHVKALPKPRLVDELNDSVLSLPKDDALEQLRKTATDFSAAVRQSPADSQMQSAQAALDQFAGANAADQARAAEQTLDGFIAKCQSMGNQAGVCLKFQPELAAGMVDSVNEMLSSMGPMGSGSGGYSAMRNSLQNVGFYGTIPLISQESSGGGGGQAQHGIATSANGSPDGQKVSGQFVNGGKSQGSGDSATSVPPQYQQRVGDYFQRVEDELSQ